MSCLLDNESRRALRVQIATDFIENIKSDKPFEILPYVKSIYEFFKTATEDEALALDAARLVPTLALQIIHSDSEIKEGLREKDDEIGATLDKLDRVYKKNIEQLREDVGAADVAAETVIETQKDIDNVVAEREAQKEQEEKLNEQFVTPYGAWRSFGLEVKNFENPNAPGYMEVDPKMAHLFNVMRAVNDKLQEQIRTNGINDSSEMTYPGVDGGVFLQVTAAPYGELKMTLVDKDGAPIKFADGTTDVSPEGKVITYNVASDPLRNASGDIITDEKEFKDALKEALKKDSKAAGRLVGAFNNVQQAIKAQTEWTKSVELATKIVKDQFALQKQMRDYLQAGEGRYVTATINGASKGVVNQNIWKYTDLNDVDFKSSPFRPVVVTTEQTAGSLYNQGTILFKYDGIEKPITAIAKSFVERQDLLSTVVQLFTGDVFKEIGGKRERLEIQERNELIEQYLFTSDVKFLSNAVGGNARNYIDSKRRMKLKIGEKEYLIRFESTNEVEAEENKKMQEEAAAALTQLLSTPFIKATEQGYGDPDLNSKEKLKDAQTQGANIVYAAENESFDEAVKAGKITPGSIFVVMRPNKKGGTDVKDAFRVYYPKLNANNKNLNTQYQDVSFKETDGKTVVQTKSKPYNQYLLNNFATPAATVNGKIRTVNTFLGFAARPDQIAKFTAVNKDATFTPTTPYGTPTGKEITTATKTEPLTTSTPLDPKADIERRRQEELRQNLSKTDFAISFFPALSQSNMSQGGGAYVEINFGKNNIFRLDTYLTPSALNGQYPSITDGTAQLHGEMNDGTKISLPWNQLKDLLNSIRAVNVKGEVSYEFNKDKINAKYDAELAALEKPETKTEPLTSKTTSSLSKEDLMKSLLNKHKTLDKGARVKAANARSTEEQLKAAEEWYSKSPLAKHFPFNIMYAAVNSNSNGPAAQWAVHGITLFHYYSKDGKLDLSKSGDFTDLYHEAWHGFTQTFLTPEQRQSLYNDLAKRDGSFVDFKGNYVQFKNADWMQLEEFAAEEFRAYAMSGGKAKPEASANTKSIFRKILDFLKNMFSGSKTADVIADPLMNDSVYNLYDKLYTGNLDAYNFNVTNRDQTIGALDHALLSTDPNSKVKELGFDDANLLVSTIDSLISKHINRINSINGDSKYTTAMMKDADSSAVAYTLAKIDLETEVLDGLKAKMEAEPLAGNKLLIQQDIELVEWAIANFGDIDNITSNRRSGKGLIAYHIEKSSFLSEEERDALSDKDIDEVASVIAATDLHAQSGNEKSQAELASPDVKTLLRSIHKYDKAGQPVNNRLGVQELNDHHQTTSSLARILNDTTSQEAMYNKLREAAIEDRAIADVRDKLGSPDTQSTISKTLWINFWSTFNMASIKLVQMTIKKEGDNYDVTIGAANTYSNKIGNLWKNAFRTQPFSPFIRPNLDESTVDTYGANYLDLPALMAEFDDNNKLKKGSEFDFLRAIGIQLSDKKAIRKAVTMEGGNVGSPTHLFRKIKRLMNERNITQLYALDDIFKEYLAESKLEMIGDEKANFNDLKELETRNADYANNYMVTNAEGNTQFEQSLHNTISVMLASINEVDSYAQLMTLPHMQYLNVKNNPFAAASIWLNSIFNMDEFAVDGIGHKRKTGGISGQDVRINMSNLSGIQLIDENGDQGISSAASDEFSKLIMDFHLNTMANKPELMRHADKGTSFSVWLDRINGGSSDNKTYQDAYTFIKNDKGNILGYDKITRIVTGYINAELTRIKRLEELSKQTDLVYDANYLKEGQQFLIFEEILKPETKEALMKYNSVDEATEANPELQGEIEAQIIEYFENQTKDVKNLMAKAGKEFIDKNLVNLTSMKAHQQGIAGKAMSNADVENGLVRAFVVNGWIHNFESMAMIYGDIAQYNMAKEDFHKRNAGAGSTGKLFAYDKGSIAYVNNKGRLYARSMGEGYPEKMMNENGEYDTAILKDNEIPSVNYDHLFDAIHKDMIRKNNNVINPDKKLSAEAVKAKATQAAKAYTENVEGDGQGWITFDFYRALSILEGKWSPQQEQMYKDIIEGKEVENATEFFPTRKFQYWGSLKVQEGQLPLTAFHKFSLVPMIPSIVGDNNLYKDRLTNLGLLQEKMMKQGIDYATFKSGSKVGNITPISAEGKAIQDKFYSDDKEHIFKEEGTFTKNTLFLPFLKDQLEIAPYFKEKVTFPTQMRKLIENGLMEGGVPTDFMVGKDLNARQKAWDALPEPKKLESKRYARVKEYEADIEALTDLRKKELEKEADIKRDKEGNIIMNDKLAAFLVGELNRQDLGEHEIAFLKQINGKLSKDLSIFLSAEKMEKVLNSVVVRRLVKQKFKGEGLIQVSGAGFESALRGELTAEEKAKYGTNGLPFYQQEVLERDKDGKPIKWGKTQAMKVKIAMQGDFVNLLHLNDNEGNQIRTIERLNRMLKNEEWLNTGDHRKMVTIIGPRIPVQGLNSMEFAEVFEFLPSEAGNIVILPTEIVAKSGGDYDIDKLTFMMPNISSGVNYDYWTTPDGVAKLENLRKDYPNLAEQMAPETVALLIAERKKENKTLEERAVLRLLADNSQRNVKYATGNSAEGLENKILNNMREILELEENFVDLIRPNGTEIVKENIADELTDLVMDFNPKTVVYKDNKGRDAKRIPGNRVFETRYNLYKHSSNNIGKQTLGLGAVDNTYNSLFNRIGARMNHTYNAKGVEKRIKILLEHNTLKDEKDNDVVSLSHILDANGENSIADVISQLMNGWVDIAKEAWIFNIQGNKEVAPVLLFMVQAGVPVKQAIYMAANPMVRAYVKEQKLAKSTFAGPLGKSPGNWRYYRNQARKVILGQPKYGINFSDTQLKNATEIEKALQSKTLELTGDQGTVLDFFNPKDVENNLLDRVKAFSAEQKKEGFLEANFYTDQDRAIFLHFLELEELAKSLTAIKTKTNVDTSRSNTLFEAQSRLEMVEDLKQDGKFPDWMVDKLIGNPEKGIKGDSPIASFNVQGFQIKLWKDFFKLRNDPMVNDFILEKMKESSYQDAVDETWGDSEKLIAQFRNGLVPFVFQNYMRNFDLDTIADYKGVGVNDNYDVKGVSSLAHGVYVKNVDSKRTFYVDKMQLKKDYLGLDKKVKKTFSEAKLNPVAFPTPGSYYNFIFERELLRSMYPADTHWSVLQERGDVQAKLKAYKKQFEGTSEAEINALVYNETLRDMALDNTFNMWKLFNSKESFADQLVQLQIMYPELAGKYAIMNTMAPSIREGSGARTANIMLTDMMMDADKVNLFNQNLRELSNPAKIKISTNNAQEIQRVTEFFKKLSIYAFLQSGMNTTGMFSLVRVVPQDRFTGQMVPYAADFMKDMNPLTLQRYWNKFLQVSKNKKLRSRLRDYSINNFNPARDKALIKNTPLSKFKMTVDPQEARMTKDNAGNPLYYANPSVNQDGIPVKGLTISEAKDLAKANPDKAFVMNGTTDSVIGADKDEKALLKAKEETGNVIPFPTRKSFSYSGFEIRDVNPTEAAEIKVEEAEETKSVTTDAFKYYGKFYDLKVIDGIAVDVLNVGKTTDKVKMLDAYNTNKNVDPQSGKPFRGATYVADKVTEKTVVVPAGSKSTNLPIFETQDKVFLMNDGQQAAYDNIKSFVLSRLNQRDNNKNGVVFNSPMTKEFSGVIPQSMWNNMIGLVGRGGVGKTSVIRKVIEDIQKEVRGGNRYGGVTVAYAAPTHNAVTMLQEALGMDSERTGGVQTLASLVKRNQTFTSKDKEPTDKGADENGLFLQEKSLYEKGLQFNPAISDNDIIVIDESSMVDSQFIKDLMFRFASEKKGRMPIFIYMGDYRQLPPVDTKAGEKKDFREGIISATLFSDENANKHSELTEVMRSKDELFHKVFDSVGNQITEQRKEVEEGKPVQTFDFAKYDALTNESSENMLVVNEKQVDAMIDDYVDTLATTDNPYEMFWTHYNNISNPRTQELFNKIRTAYFKRIGVPMPTGTMKAKNGATRYEIGVGDYIQSTFNLPFETKNDKQLGIEKGIIKPTARFKVLDIIQSEVSLSQLNSDLQRALGKNIDIAVKKIVLYNRQGQKRVVVFPVNNDTISIVGYNAAKRAQTLSIKDKEGKSHQVDIQYGKWKEIMNEVLQLNQSVEEMFLPSYIGSTHTVQGASIKKIIVGDYNIRLNAPNIAMRDMESSLYTALTRASEKLIIIKPNNAQIKDNQDVFQLKTVDKVPATIDEAKEVAAEGAPEKVNFDKKGLFTVKPQPGVADEKAEAKASIATQYIGFGEGIVGSNGKRSSTQLYREQAGALANTGNYSRNDVVFVSVPGKRGSAEIAKREQDKTIREAIKALEAGATILTDNQAYTNASSYNSGEQRLLANLKEKGYKYSEITVDKQLIGTWVKDKTQDTVKEKASISTKEVLPLINGQTIDPRVKAQIDATIQSMLEYKANGYELAFPASGFGQYMIGADDNTGIIDPKKSPIARATFVYLSEQLFKNFQYVNPNFEKALYDQDSINVVQAGAPITDEEVQQALDYFEKTCKG